MKRTRLATVTVGAFALAACSNGGGSGGGAYTDGADASDSASSASGDATATASGGDGDEDGTPPPADTPLDERLTVSNITVPEGVEQGDSNWRIWGRGPLHVAPVYSVPLDNCETLVCYTTTSGQALTARVAHISADDTLVDTWTVGAGYECRGLAAEPDGKFAALLFDDAADEIHFQHFGADGTPDWKTILVNANNDPTEFGIGDSRAEYGNGTYGAYYHVHSNDGHEGDTLKWADAASGAETTGWGWGCSHSMSNLLRYNDATTDFMPACVTDCFPGTSGDFGANAIGGVYLNHNQSKVIDVDAGCNGDVAGELGSASPSPAGWHMVFNAHQNPATPGQGSYDPSAMNQDIAFVPIGTDLSAGSLVWLTDTQGIDEADSSVAYWTPADDDVQQFVVGWSEPGATAQDYVYKLARVDASGSWLEDPVDVTAQVQWGRRDDPFRRAANGDVVWAWFDEPAATTMHFARLDSGGSCN